MINELYETYIFKKYKVIIKSFFDVYKLFQDFFCVHFFKDLWVIKFRALHNTYYLGIYSFTD